MPTKMKADPPYDAIVKYVKEGLADARKNKRRFRLSKDAATLAKDSMLVLSRLEVDLEKYLRTKMPAVARRIRSRGKILSLLSKEFRRVSV
jgi:hypothetical protein